jgi:hypothetical protein
MSPWFETHYRLRRVVSAMQLSTDARKPVPRADFLAERIPSDIFNLSVNSARKYAENQIGSDRSSTSARPVSLSVASAWE